MELKQGSNKINDVGTVLTPSFKKLPWFRIYFIFLSEADDVIVDINSCGFKIIDLRRCY